MSERLSRALENIRLDAGISGLGEASVRQVVVLQLLNALEWDQFNRAEVTPEFAVGGGRVDYSLQIGGQSKVFIEVKRGGEDLFPHQDQLLRYSFERGVSLAVLTNGLDWWFYLPLKEGSWEERRFSDVDITSEDRDNVKAVLFNVLSKDRVVSGSAIEYGENLLERRREDRIVNESLPKAWDSLVAEPDELLVELLVERVEQISQISPDSSLVRSFILDKVARASNRPLTEPIPQARRVPARSVDPVASVSQRGTENGLRLTGSAIKKKPVSFHFLGTEYPVKTWKDILQKLSEIMYNQFPDDFRAKVSGLRGSSRAYYTCSEGDLDEPRPVGSSGWFVETKFPADDTLKRCHELLNVFGYDKSDLEIYVRR